MSDPYLPPEMLDYIVDYLHDEPETLKQSCLVSKSWVPRTRNHLFADIGFPTLRRLYSWKEIFPDPANSPARYVKTLFIGPSIITAADLEVGGWIGGFSRVECLEVVSQGLLPFRPSPLVPFHGFSPVVKSLRLTFPVLPPPWIFSFILSFPVIEHLTVIIRGGSVDNGDDSDWLPTATQPLPSPVFTGSLVLYLKGGMEPFISQLLSVPGGIHLRKLTLTWFREEDLLTTTSLVEGCSHTLESLRITGEPLGTCVWHPRPCR
jgi:hypothetical protein